jgi:hypothetical protein
VAAGTTCTGGACDSDGRCITWPQCVAAADCNDDNRCTSHACIFPPGVCNITPLPGGTACPTSFCDGTGRCLSPPFDCAQRFILTGNPSTLNVLDPNTGAFTAVGTAGELLSASGIDPTDGQIYAVTRRPTGAQHLVRVGSNGTFTDLGVVPNLTGRYPAGCFLADGTYLVFGEDNGNFVQINVNTSPPGIIRFAHAPGNNPRYADIAVDPLTGAVWGYDSAASVLGRINPDTGVLTAVCRSFPGGNTSYVTAAALFDQAGNLLLYGTPPDNPSTNVQDRLIQVNLATCGTTAVATGPSVTDGDAASCSMIGSMTGHWPVIDGAQAPVAGGP